ncbi:MAG: ABC transporter permease [Solirubrobacteraceae bacterium]|jgi:peptide/nickel transport system permease protein
MKSFAARRLAGLVATCFITSVVVFGALHLAPGDPVSFLFKGRQPTPQQIAAVRAHYHLNDPLPEQYVLWVKGLFQGNFGQSIVFDEPVSALISSRLPTTLWLVGLASIWTIVLGIWLGALAARRRGPTDDGIMVLTTIGMATPSFVLAAVFIAVFAVDLGWFPVFGAGSGIGSRLDHMFLPSLALALSLVGLVARATRASVRQELGRDHVATAEARGLAPGLIFRRHVLRNSLGPVSTITGLALASLLAGTVIIETAFGLNGLGNLLIQSVLNNDFPVVQAVTLILVVAFVLVNTTADLIAAAIDPRLRTAKAA